MSESGHQYRPFFEPTVRAIAIAVSIIISLAVPVAWYWKIAIFVAALYLAMRLARMYVMHKFRQWYPPRPPGSSL